MSGARRHCMEYFSVSDADFPLVSLSCGIAVYRAPPGLHPRACMMWACGKVRNGVRVVEIRDADGALVASAR